MTDAVQTVVSAAEYARMAETNTPTELIAGVIVVTPAPTPEHQQCSASLYRAVYPLIPNGRLYYAPIDVYFDESNVVQPDLVWVSEGGRCTVGAKWLEGPPDLIVEYQRHGVYVPGDTFESPVLAGRAVDVGAIFAP